MPGKKGAVFQDRVCKRCGKEFTPRSGPQKYCLECKAIVTKGNRDRFRATEKERRKNERCCICGDPFGEMIDGKPYCWKHRRRYRKYGSFDLPGKVIIAKKFLPIQIGIVKNVDFSERMEFLPQRSADCLALGHGLGGVSLILDYENIKWAHKVSHWSMN